MGFDVGVNVIETDGRAAAALQAAPTSVAALVGLTERGMLNRPVRVSSPTQFRTRFGNYRNDGYLAYAVEGFFLNGGREAHVIRVAGAGSAAASATLNNRAAVPGPAVQVSAGYRGESDPGSWGNRLRVDVRDDPRGSTTVQAAVGGGSTSLQLQSIVGFRVGSIARIADGTSISYRKVTGVDPATRTIQWDSTAPVGAALSATTQVTTAEFRLIVRYQSTSTADFEVVEDWRNLSMESDVPDHIETRLNHPLTGSRYIAATDTSGTTASGIENPAVISNQALGGGSEIAPGSAEFIGDAATKTGLHALDTVQIQLLAVPDAHTFNGDARDSVVRAALDYCALRGDCMFVGAAPDRGAPVGVTPRALSDYTQAESNYLNTIKEYAATFQGSKVFGALYGAWIRVADPIAPGPAPARFIPPDGHIMGIYARTDQERGIWKAPAGLSAQIRGALNVSATFTNHEHTDMVQNALVNGVRRESGSGIIVTTSRTLSTDTRWWFVSTRLLFNFVKTSLRDGLRFVRQEPHTAQLRSMVRLNVVTPFLSGLWRQGAFGSDPPEMVFTVKCDAENNPPADVDQGIFRVEVYFYPVRPVETIILIVGQQPSGASVSEA